MALTVPMVDPNFDKDILTPLGGHGGAPTRAKRSLLRDIDGAIYGLSILAAILSFGLSAYFFYGFWETDKGVLTLLNSAALCFGVGSMAFGPAIVIAISARRALRGTARAGSYIAVLMMALPWLALSLLLCFGSAMPLLYGVFALFISISWTIWAFFRLRRLRAP